MAELNINQMKLTESQIGFVLNDIAMSAKSIQRFSVMLRHEDDERNTSALIQGIGSLAERIGLLADKTADEGFGIFGACYGGDVDEWMMPPAYHEQESADESKVSHA